MTGKIVTSVLLVALVAPTTATAQSLRAAAEKKAAEFPTQQAPARGNPYKIPAIALMAGGAGLLGIGLMQERGVKAEGDIFAEEFEIKETGGSKTALVSLGILGVAGGAGLWFWGENKKNRPSISMGSNQFQVKVRF